MNLLQDFVAGPLEPALQLEHGFEIRAGANVTAAYLRQLSADLMRLAIAVAKHEQGATTP